jgi:hypothetical protein
VQALLRKEGRSSLLAQAIGSSRKNETSIALYALALPLSFWHAQAGAAIDVVVALLWLVPERRIEALHWD